MEDCWLQDSSGRLRTSAAYFSHTTTTVSGLHEHNDERLVLSSACRIGLAIEAYRGKHQHIPVTLNELIPEFLDSIPIDRLDGKPLRFETTAEGYRIYSVGENGKDGEGPGSLYFGGPELVLEVPRPRKVVERQREEMEDIYQQPGRVR